LVIISGLSQSKDATGYSKNKAQKFRDFPSYSLFYKNKQFKENLHTKRLLFLLLFLYLSFFGNSEV